MSRTTPESRSKTEPDYMSDDEMDPDLVEMISRRNYSGRRSMPAVLPRPLREESVGQPMTTVIGGKIAPDLGSVFLRGFSPVQGAIPHTPLSAGGGDGNLGESRMGETMEVQEETHEGLMARWAAASDDVRHGLRLGDDQDGLLGHQPVPSSGNFRFFSLTQPQALRNTTERSLPPGVNREMGAAERVSTPTPSNEEYFSERGSKEAMVGREQLEYSGGVPVRFQKGRESLSVQRNVTIRDSKRPKARSSDEDYRRRVSGFPATMRLALEAHSGASVSPGTTRYHRENDSRGETHVSRTHPFEGSSGGNGGTDLLGPSKRGGPLLDTGCSKSIWFMRVSESVQW